MIWLHYLNWQCTMLEIVYVNQPGTSYWHCLSCSSLSYKASPGAPRYSEVCLVLTTLKMEKRRSALANKDMPCSKQIQKGNIKGHLGDEKGNCCTWQYTYRHIHLGMYTHTSIYIPPQICYICFQTLATILPVRCQTRVTQCTVPVLCCSVFPKLYLPHYHE